MAIADFSPTVTVILSACVIFSIALHRKGATRNRWLVLAMVTIFVGLWWMALARDLATNVFFVQVLAVAVYGLAGLSMLEEHRQPTIQYLILSEWVPPSDN
ncbi:hypothetical protein M1432_03270 [Patescibacteria group bacterium]|nr:hypothetical protein [Patescibacteria group bacterium]